MEDHFGIFEGISPYFCNNIFSLVCIFAKTPQYFLHGSQLQLSNSIGKTAELRVTSKLEVR